MVALLFILGLCLYCAALHFIFEYAEKYNKKNERHPFDMSWDE